MNTTSREPGDQGQTGGRLSGTGGVLRSQERGQPGQERLCRMGMIIINRRKVKSNQYIEESLLIRIGFDHE